MADRPRLNSWKEIARHLGRDVRTVLRWERHRGLPVHRVPGGRLPRVFAYPNELDDWLAKRQNSPNGDEEHVDVDVPSENGELLLPPPDAGRRTRWRVLIGAAAAGAFIAVAGVMVWSLRGDTEPPQRLAIVGNTLVALDASGATRWTHRFESSDLTSSPALWSRIGDLNDDGRADVLAAIELTRQASGQHAGELLRFSHDGRPQWTMAVEDRVTFRDEEYGPPWTAGNPAVYRAGGELRIAWPVHHFTWWPGLLITLNAQGHRLGTFVNSGWIQDVTPSIDGRYLFISGVTNSRRAYFVAVLDATNPTGRSPEPPGSATECVGCPSGEPLHYFVLARTDVSREEPFPTGGPTLKTFEDGTLQVHALESGGPNIAATIYELSSDLGIRRAKFSDSYWEWHRLLEKQGKLQHGAEDCPARRGLDVQRWTPAAGWQHLQVAVN